MSKNILFGDWLFFFSVLFLAAMFLYQAWANLVQRKVSNFSIDRLMLVLSEKFASPKNRAETRRLSKDQKRLIIFGLLSLLYFLACVKTIFAWIQQF
jgi:hypothetical protein